MTQQLEKIFTRILSSRAELIQSNISEGKNWFNIQLVAEEGELLITLFLSDKEIKDSLKTAVHNCFPNRKLSTVSIISKDLISFCLR